MRALAIRPTLLLLAATGLAVTGPVGPAAAQPAASEEELAAEALPPPDETREEKLDRLFAALATADSEEGEKIAGEIRSVWSRSGSDSMDLLLERARKAMMEENHERARMHVAALTRLAPDFAEGWNMAATLAYLDEDFGRALLDIERTLALEPRHYSALVGLATILERLDRENDAMRAWREAARLYPALDQAGEAIRRLEPEVDGRAL